MSIKYTQKNLSKVENILVANNYKVRYEKGNFKAGYCILKSQKIIIINQYFTLEGKINALLHIVRKIGKDLVFENLNEDLKKFYNKNILENNTLFE